MMHPRRDDLVLLILAAVVALLALGACSSGGGAARPETPAAAEREAWQDVVEGLRTENVTLRRQLAAAVALPTDLGALREQLALAHGRVKALEGQQASLLEQERQEASARWRLRITIISLLAAVGLGVAAIALPALPAQLGLRRYLGLAAGAAAVVPLLLRMFGDIERHAAWAWPLAAVAVALCALPKLRQHLLAPPPGGA